MDLPVLRQGFRRKGNVMRSTQELLEAAEEYAKNYRCDEELRCPIFVQHLTWLINQQLARCSHDMPRRKIKP